MIPLYVEGESSLPFVLMIIISVVVGVLFLYGFMEHINGQTEGLTFQEPEVKPVMNCLEFSDGRFVVVKLDCTPVYELISWLLSKGYHIDEAHDVNDDYDRMFLSR